MVNLCNTDTHLDLHTLQLLETRAGGKVKIIDSVALQWRELAISLGFDQDAIDSIADTYLDSDEACREMLAKWLEDNEHLKGPVTWNTFIQCLVDAGQLELASELEEVLML